MKKMIYMIFLIGCSSLISLGGNIKGFSLRLDGNGDYVDFGNISMANFDTTDFTIECWVIKLNTRTEALITKRETCNRSVFWSMRPALKSQIELDDNQNYLIRSSNQPIADSTWHHIALTRKKSIVKMYIDAVLDTTYSTGGTTSISNSANVQIGNGPCINADITKNFTGYVDEVRIWQTARSEFQIRMTYGDTLGSSYYATADSGLVGYWRFDQLEDLGINQDGIDDVRDYSIYQNHGDFVGDATLENSQITTSIESKSVINLTDFQLYQNYPNPFNPSTTIEFTLPKSEFVELRIYNILGKEVAMLVSETLNAGNHTYTWDATGFASGVYYYRIEAGNYSETRKMIYLK